MSDDVIRRSDAIKAVEETPFIRRPILPHYLKAKIKDIPSAENKGEWDEKGNCTNCGRHAPFWAMATTYYRSKYCPNCGCRMKGADNE